MEITDEHEKLKNKIIDFLNRNLSKKRITHTKNVVDTGIELALRFGIDTNPVEIASYCHDMMREADIDLLDSMMKEACMPDHYIGNRNLSHGKAAAMVMERDFGIFHKGILDAVSYHTTGRPGMSTLEKIIYLADAIEPSRRYPGIDSIRETAKKDLTAACLMSMEALIKQITVSKDRYDPITIKARDALKKEIMKGERDGEPRCRH